MNTLIFVGLFMCVFVAYTSALPYPSEVVAEAEPKGDGLVAIETRSEGESLIPAESAWGGHGWGHGGGGRGWGGYGGGWGHGGGWGYGGGWGHNGYRGSHHGGHRWGR